MISEDIFAAALASIGDGVIVTDPAGHVTFLNPEAERLTGWSAEEAHGQPLASIFRIVNQETRAAADDPVTKVLQHGAVVALANHTLLIARDGRETPIDDSAAPVRRRGGALEGVVLVFRDVTVQRQAAEAHSRLAAIVQGSGDAIISKDLDGIVRTWNPAAEELFGYRAEEIVGRSIRILIPEERADEEERILGRLRRGEATVRLHTIRVTKDGRRLPVWVTSSPVRNDAGDIVGASKIVHDLSEVVAVQEALRREKELLATTLASIGDGVIVADTQGRVTYLNPVAETLTGWHNDEAQGRSLTEVFHIVNEQTRREVTNPALRAIAEGLIVGLANHTLLISRAGPEKAIDDSAAPIRADGAIVGAVLVFRDVTERRAAELELRANREELLRTDERKNTFLATLAHELRNPLAPIENSVALLELKGASDPAAVSARQVIRRQVAHMARLLEDLLDVNRLDRHALELRRQPVNLTSVLASAIETAQPIVAERRHHLSLDIPGEPLVLDGDAVRLAQVFSNLLHNAAKYMDPGGRIEVTATREGDEVVVRVCDEGMGIAPEVLPGIFEMFSQTPWARERAPGGVGIGLALAKRLVELHGGTIAAHSDGPGMGATLVVRLPLSAAATETPPAVRPTRLVAGPGRRILVADDLRDNADTLSEMLRTLGNEVHTVYDGESAVAAAAELRPEVVILDIGMPGIDGYEACRRIRKQPWGPAMLLVAQTGWGQEEDRARAAAAGFDRHLLKPVTAATLSGLLAEF